MAVYTALTESEIREFLSAYAVGALQSFAGIAEGVTNSNYLIEAGDARYILTLFEKRYRIEDLPYFAALMQWWRARDIACPEPIRMKDGRVLGALAGKPAMLVSFLEGAPARRITPAHTACVGALAAAMHIGARDFPHARANGLSLSAWKTMIDEIGDQADRIEPGLSGTIAQEYRYLSEHWPDGLPAGPVHADLFPDNIFFDPAAKRPSLSGVIDCYFACNDAWAYDLAIAINAWCFDDRHRFMKDRADALLQGYTDTRPLEPAEEAAMPVLLRGAALRFLLTRTFDMLYPDTGAQVTLKDPLEYARKLEFFQSHFDEKTR